MNDDKAHHAPSKNKFVVSLSSSDFVFSLNQEQQIRTAYCAVKFLDQLLRS